jgi:hypothetical protein
MAGDSFESSRSWCLHFLRNRNGAQDFPWDCGYSLTPVEKAAIAPSVQQFQLGEGSNGRRLLARAEEYAALTDDAHFHLAMRLFVKEEQRHSAYLARFMTRQGIPLVAKHWVDSAFRGFRHMAGLELSLRVLCTAEIIAVPYYRALAEATQSPLLRAISERILRDEAAHLRFQSWMMALLNASRSLAMQRLYAATHAEFLLGTCCVVWREHGPVFRAAGYSFKRFVTEAFEEFSELRLATASPRFGLSARQLKPKPVRIAP